MRIVERGVASGVTFRAAYTMFNVYLPKLLETRSNMHTGAPKTLEETMWDIVIFTLGGCPGAIVRFHFLFYLGMINISRNQLT